MSKVDKDMDYGVSLQDAAAEDMRKHPEMAGKKAAEAQAKTDVAKQSGTPTTENSQANAYDPSIRLNNNVQYVINILKTYGYPQQVLDSFKQDIDKILNNTKDNNRIDTANQYIDQFLGDKQDLRRLDPVPGKPAPNQQPQKAGNKNKPGKKPRMSDDEIDAFLKEELGGNTTGGTYASPEVPKGGTKTIGYDPYDPNPGNVSLAYAMRNAPEQERRTALIDKWNRENGISYVTGKDGLIYRMDPQHPNGYVDPFKNDLSKTGSTYASPSIGNGGMYATGEGIKDANGNVLTNPGGNWEYQYALKNPQYGLGMMGKMSDAQRNYLQAVSDNMGYKYNFTGATRFV